MLTHSSITFKGICKGTNKCKTNKCTFSCQLIQPRFNTAIQQHQTNIGYLLCTQHQAGPWTHHCDKGLPCCTQAQEITNRRTLVVVFCLALLNQGCHCLAGSRHGPCSWEHGAPHCFSSLILAVALLGLFDSSLLHPQFSMDQNHWENLYGIFVSRTRGILLIFIWWKPRMLNILQSPGQSPVVKSYPTSCQLPNVPPELPIDKNSVCFTCNYKVLLASLKNTEFSRNETPI